MATSVYFNNYNSQVEQRVVEDLIVESIKIMGFDAYYCPIFNPEDRDILYGEDPVKKFKSAFPVEFYLSSALEYSGEREFFSKFGLEIKNNATVILSKRSFSQRVPQNEFTRPREGDLVYVPFLNGTGELFEIKFVNQTKDFFTLGRKIPFFYELELEKFKYSQEFIETGVYEVDDSVTQSGYTIELNVSHGANNYIQKEIVYQAPDQTQANATAVAVVQHWNNVSQILSVTNIAGEFVNNHIIIGAVSNARHTLVSFDPLKDSTRNETYDNLYIENQANNITDFTEINPFGKI
jgi:Virus neck protein